LMQTVSLLTPTALYSFSDYRASFEAFLKSLSLRMSA
jgi:hypothetical protein